MLSYKGPAASADLVPLKQGFLGLDEQLAPKDAPLVRFIPFGLEPTNPCAR